MSDELDRLYQRVEAGQHWLIEHDPTGAFHLWFTGGILPGSPKPSAASGMAEGYAVYYPARRTWEQLWAAMVRLEKKEGATSAQTTMT